jgi:hypothetical protein
VAEHQVDYNAADNPTLQQFHRDNSFVRAIMGPVGSGKSVACTMETLFRANEQAPLKGSNCRPVKWAVVRNTYRELEDTTIATFQQWIPPELGHYRASGHSFQMEWPHPSGDGTYVSMEVLFRALDTPKDARKLLSLEVTGGWFNEAREIPWGIIDLFQTRVGRWPPHKQGGATWDGVWIDTNPPDEDSEFYRIFEEDRPEGYRLFRQPGGTTPRAENVANLRPGYYDRLRIGKTEDWIRVYVDADYGFVADGRPVHPEYNDRIHCQPTAYTPGLPIILGADFGLTPACVFMQEQAGSFACIDEVVTENLGAVGFAEQLKRVLNSRYPGAAIEAWGDPAGDQRSAIRESDTVFGILRQAGLPFAPAPSQDPVRRREAVSKLLTTLAITGLPRLVVGPQCKYLRKGLRGGYAYKRLQVSGGERFHDKPDKNIYSHICEGLEYGLLGAGEGYNFTDHQRRPAVPRVIGALR